LGGGLSYRVEGLGLEIWGLEFRFRDLGFGVFEV